MTDLVITVEGSTVARAIERAWEDTHDMRPEEMKYTEDVLEFVGSMLDTFARPELDTLLVLHLKKRLA